MKIRERKKIKILKERINSPFKEIKKEKTEEFEDGEAEDEFEGLDDSAEFSSSSSSRGFIQRGNLGGERNIEQAVQNAPEIKNSASQETKASQDSFAYDARYSGDNYSGGKHQPESASLVKPSLFIEKQREETFVRAENSQSSWASEETGKRDKYEPFFPREDRKLTPEKRRRMMA